MSEDDNTLYERQLMKSESFNLALMTNGASDNIKLWSGTPTRLKKEFRALLGGESVSCIDYSLPRLFKSFCFRLFIRNHEFVLGCARDPWYRWWTSRRLDHLIEKNALTSGWFFFVCDYVFGRALVKSGRKYVIYSDNGVYEYFPLLRGKVWWRKKYEEYLERQDRILLDRAALIFTQNEWMRQCLIKRFDLSPDKVLNVGFGVNLEPYSGDKDYSQENLLIVLRRGTEHYKGLDLLLDAFELLKKKRPQATLSVVGTTAREIAGVSYYEGFPRSKTVELFQRSTLYVMPALREPNGITYLEALANRSPIVGLNRFAFPEFSGYGQWGFSVQNEDPAELANVLNEALSDKERLRAMGEAGQRFVVDRYDWHKVCRNMIDIMHRYDQRSVE